MTEDDGQLMMLNINFPQGQELGTLERVLELLKKGYTSGYEPTWDINTVQEANDKLYYEVIDDLWCKAKEHKHATRPVGTDAACLLKAFMELAEERGYALSFN